MEKIKKIIVISAHPDDLEIGCSGTLKKLHSQGYNVLSIITIQPSEEDNPNRNKTIVESELNTSYTKSGWRCKIFETDLHQNGRPNLIVDNVTITNLSKLVEYADIAILQNPEDYHQDHVSSSKIALPLVRQCKQIWYMHSYPYSKFYKTSPNLYVDISEQWDFKKELLNCYSSTLDKNAIDAIEVTNRFYGLQTNSSHAEAFTVVKQCL